MTEYTSTTKSPHSKKNALEYDFGRPPLSVVKRDFVGSFKVNVELWSRFKEGCAERGVSICHVLEALMEAWLAGQKATATVLKPVVVNLTMQHVVQRPRRLYVGGPDILHPVGCDGLEHRDWGLGYLGWCDKHKRWVHVEDCVRCPLSRQKST